MSARPPSPRTQYPRVKVILHRADAGLMVVMKALRDLTRYGEAEASFRMWDAHHNGRTLVLVTHLERAELYVEQFGERGLAATLEPA